MTSTLEKLGAALDAAERDADDNGGCVYFDFEVAGVLHHDALSCWQCRMKAAASAYRAAVRAAAFKASKPKRLRFRPFQYPSEIDASYAVYFRAYDAAKSAEEFYAASIELGASERAIINAAAAYELAERDRDLLACQIREYDREKKQRAADRRAGIVRRFPQRRVTRTPS